MDAMGSRPTGGNASADCGVFELLEAGDYILEAELSLSRPIGTRLRKGQQDDLRQTLRLIEDAASKLPEGPLKNWAAMLYNRTSQCLRKVSATERTHHTAPAGHPCPHGSPAV